MGGRAGGTRAGGLGRRAHLLVVRRRRARVAVVVGRVVGRVGGRHAGRVAVLPVGQVAGRGPHQLRAPAAAVPDEPAVPATTDNGQPNIAKHESTLFGFTRAWEPIGL